MNWHGQEITLAVDIFALSSLAILYAYALYPLVLIMMARLQQGEPVRPGSLNEVGEHKTIHCPLVSVIIPVHNEESWIARKVDNTLSWDYPADRLDVIVVSDGSTDRTNNILRGYQNRVGIVQYHPRRGKPTALNRAVAMARGDILVFSDVNVMVEPKAVRAMVARYADPDIGAVSGNVALRSFTNGEPLGEGIYMRYERWLYDLDSRANTMVGMDGAFFSLRRALFVPLPADTIVDDFAIALWVIARKRRVVYEPKATAAEIVVPNVQSEYGRKARMIAGGYQALSRARYLLNPQLYPSAAFQLLSHKLLRWMVPIFMVTAFLSSVIGAFYHPILTIAAAVQTVFYGLALLGLGSYPLRRFVPVYLPYYFCAVNVAATVGLWRFLHSSQPIAWEKVSRADMGLTSSAR